MLDKKAIASIMSEELEVEVKEEQIVKVPIDEADDYDYDDPFEIYVARVSIFIIIVHTYESGTIAVRII